MRKVGFLIMVLLVAGCDKATHAPAILGTWEMELTMYADQTPLSSLSGQLSFNSSYEASITIADASAPILYYWKNDNGQLIMINRATGIPIVYTILEMKETEISLVADEDVKVVLHRNSK